MDYLPLIWVLVAAVFAWVLMKRLARTICGTIRWEAESLRHEIQMLKIGIVESQENNQDKLRADLGDYLQSIDAHAEGMRTDLGMIETQLRRP